MAESGQIIIRRVTDHDIARHLAELLVENSDTSYISHGELQTGRAMSAREWTPDVVDRIEDEFESAITSEEKDVLAAFDGESLVGLLVAEKHVRQGYGVIADVVISKKVRHRGVGEKIVDRAEKMLLEKGIYRIFIESGISNHVAHQFFLKRGFEPVSKVFMKQMTMDEKLTDAVSKLVKHWCGLAEGLSKEQLEVFRASLTGLIVGRINMHDYSGNDRLWICTDYGACETLESAWETATGKKTGTMLAFPWKESTFVDIEKKEACIEWKNGWKKL